MKRIFYVLVLCLSAGTINAQWQSSNAGLTGGYVDNLAADPATHYIYAGTNQGGMYQSKDNGGSWNSVSNGLPQGSITAITISGNTIYAGTTSGVYLSDNNGSSWTGKYISAVSNASSIVVDGGKIYAGSQGFGVSLSTDNCGTWNFVNNGLTGMAKYVSAITIISGNLILGTADGVYLSSNSGGLWTKSNTGLTSGVTSFAIMGSNIFAGTYDGVFVSGNNGTSWTKVSNGLTGSGLYINRVYVNGTSLYAATEAGIYSSTNNGANWTPKNNGLGSNLSLTSLTSDGIYLFTGNRFGGGVFRTSDAGTTWIAVNNGFFDAVITGIVQSGDNIFTSGYGIAMSANHGSAWAYVNNGIPASGFISCEVAVRGTKIFCGTMLDGMLISENNGSSWSAINNGLSGNSLNIYALEVSGNNIFAGTGNGVFLSVNDGASWSVVMPSLSTWTLASYGNFIYAYTQSGLFMSTNNGGTWSKPDNGLPDAKLSQIAKCGTYLFAATDRGVYMSEDNGVTWVPRFGENSYPVSSIVVSGDLIFASTVDVSDGGIYVSNDNGITWDKCNDGLATVNIYKLAITDNSVIAGTRAYGAFKRPVSDFKLLSVSSDNLEIGTETHTTTFNIISNTSWTISVSESWLSAASAGGSGNSTITLTAELNNTGEARSALVTVSGNGVADRFIDVSQAIDLTTEVKTQIMDYEIRIFPNPATNTLNLTGISENTLASIYDSQGRLVLTNQLKDNLVDISNLSIGFYIIKLNNNHGVTFKRFVKNK